MNIPRLHGAATAFLLLLCALGISIGVSVGAPHGHSAEDASPWPVDAVSVDPALTAHDTELLAAQVRAQHSRHAAAASSDASTRRR